MKITAAKRAELLKLAGGDEELVEAFLAHAATLGNDLESSGVKFKSWPTAALWEALLPLQAEAKKKAEAKRLASLHVLDGKCHSRKGARGPSAGQKAKADLMAAIHS